MPADEKRHVLVIDDDAMNREIIEAFLLTESYDVHLANNGASGIQLAREIQPDLIILDVRMPDMNGYEVAQVLRADSSTAELAILMLSGFNSHEDEQKGYEAGVNDYLSRPFDGDDFLARVAKLCEKR